ncbi:MAG: hypothetical protein IPP33_18180 [Flavobacteriales bacterium]|nr:hypothetical protein [Flavobacteriales bacterium]
MKKHAARPGPFGANNPPELLHRARLRGESPARHATRWHGVDLLAMDAFSRYAIHHTIQRTNILPDYVSFIFEVLRKDPEVKGATLAIDGRPDLAAPLHKVFPHFEKVVCDDARVYEVTEEFHVAFLAHMGQQGRGN